jgi:hypothetical protein
MAFLSKVKNPFSGQDIAKAYYKLDNFAFEKGQAGRIGFQVFKSEADRRGNKKPYPLSHEENNVAVAQEDMTSIEPLFAEVVSVLEVLPEFSEATKDGSGFVMPFEDEYGENHEEAYWIPTFIEGSVSAKSVLFRISVYASVTAYESGVMPFPVSAQTALGGSVRIGEQGVVQQNPSLPDFDTFITALDATYGRPQMYGIAKSKKFEDSEDII